MSTVKKLKGGDIMLFVDGKAIAFSTNHTLTLTGDTQETTNKDEGGMWQSNEISKLSWTANSESITAASGNGKLYDQLIDLMIAAEPIALTFAPKAETDESVPTAGWTASGGYKGNAVITNVTINAQSGERSTFTVDFTGTGPLTKNGATTEEGSKS